MRPLILILLTLTLLPIACAEKDSESLLTPDLMNGDEMAFPEGKHRPLTKDEMVIRNCLLVKAAVEAWSVEAGGGYPWQCDDENAAGHSVIDLLPGGQPLVNPYHAGDPQPSGGWSCDASPGDITYLGCQTDEGGNGYIISGRGESGEVCRYSVNWPGNGLAAVDSLTIENCYKVRSAVERFAAENDGMFPIDSTSRTPLGRRPTDFLPGGTLLRNPLTSARTEPVWGCAAAVSGETGYIVVQDEYGDNVGYIITGFGCGNQIIVIEGPVGREEPVRAHPGEIPNS